MLAFLCTGQGAQKPGMLSPWLEDPACADRLTAWSDALGLDLVHLGTRADAETIKDTAVAQPLIVAASLLSYLALLDTPDTPDSPAVPGAVVAGHSVGELAAAAVAGVLTADDALTLVRERGRAMAQAAAVTPTGMSAVVGGTPDGVADALAAAGLTAANVNGGGQVVAAGTLEQLESLAADPPARARVIPLAVAGAFHTEHMAGAVDAVRATAGGLAAHAPAQGRTLLSNRDGQAVRDGQDAVDRIVAQVANPVRWDLCCETMLGLGVTGAVELCPGGVLTGLAKRTLKGVEVLALTGPEDLPAARDLLSRHGGTR